ncbi:MAG: glycine--tRNA ligase subunit beta [Anaerolineales bacterium]|nr:glycine--tRNA ligase subunit beta [Anaerolineales bacterium]
MTEKATFQEIILKLQNFWAERGAVLWQPYYTQVGAGTMNPATFLRVLGPEPWNVAYVEPSVRPDDGRYGENPNRFQVHYQFQVILKPDPADPGSVMGGEPQELYLDSLKAIGIDPRQHDIRFVEDNWEQPAISAWGLGWEVWLDGQEITQFTYFQQVGGTPLDPVAVELTYGLERILIALNNAEDIWGEEWAPGVTYGEVRRREEFEHSKYYFEVADVTRMREVFERFEAECNACLEQGLVLPAHDYVLKCSHIFNTLDTRGAIGVTERQGYFRRMRELARRVAVAYLEQRKELEYPLLKTSDVSHQTSAKVSSLKSDITSPTSFLLEIGVEELPHTDVNDILTQFRERVPAWLDELRLEHGPVRVEATPRRAAVFVETLSPSQPDLEDLVKGPPADKAFDPSGVALPAAMGFAKKSGVDTKDLVVREENGGKYVFAVVKSTGRPAPEVLAKALPELVAGINFTKSMRWNESGVAFSRPIRWFVSLLGETVIPFEYAGVVAGNVTRGLRPYDSPEITIPSADKYFDVIRESGIVIDVKERKSQIVEQVKQAADLVKGQAIIDDDLLAEVANLVEMPTAVMGGFPEEYLDLPRDVLISVMKKHQRYFPVENVRRDDVRSADNASGTSHSALRTLLPYFIAIRNGDDLHLDIVREGNEHVLNARFADADFFVREDLKYPLEYYRPGLSKLIFQTVLGSMLDKSDRMLKLGAELGAMLGLRDVMQLKHLARSVYLAKADLVTQMVTEMTSLQGVIGREYAQRSGEDPEVAAAIGEQYQTVPQTQIGMMLALTDRLDSLVGLFAAGLAPSGAKDPFALRRAAIGTVQPLIEHELDFDLRRAVALAAQFQPVEVNDEVQNQVLDFIAGRLSVLLKESYRYDVVDAVLAAQSDNPASAARAVKQLQAWVEREDWNEILPAYARCVRIIRAAEVDNGPLTIDDGKLTEQAERDLYEALRSSVVGRPSSVDEFLSIVVALIPTINKFFDEVLVMAEEEDVRGNRLALVGRIANLSHEIADLSKLEGF